MEEIQPVVEQLIGSYGWLLIVGAMGIILKSLISNIAEGIMVMMGKDVDLDDVLYLDGRRMRVIRQTIRRTYFHVEDQKYGTFKTVLIVPNERVKNFIIEKKLNDNGK